MKITILNTSKNHPINSWLNCWIDKYNGKHEIKLIRSKIDIDSGDILFLISCSDIIFKSDREKFNKTLLIHASDLPKGRGWSPHIWSIINGEEKITLSLLEAADKIDSGDIWKKIKITIPNTALYEEINKLIFSAELELMDFAIENFLRIIPYEQPAIEPSYYSKRMPQDSEINIYKSIDEQFDLIRVSDEKRFPAFFYKNGQKFKLKIEKMND